MDKILITGGNGNLGKELINTGVDYTILHPNSDTMNILDIDSVESFIVIHTPKYLIHSAALTKPMSVHDDDISKSIDINIIGTANIVKICKKYSIKLIYISTDYVYPPGSKYVKECDGLQPVNNYGWSKLGGECSVQMYKNSLILRLSFLNKPFPYSIGATNIIRNIQYIDEVSKIILSILDEFGVLNIGSDEIKSMYQKGLETNSNITPFEVEPELANEKSIILDTVKLYSLIKNKI